MDVDDVDAVLVGVAGVLAHAGGMLAGDVDIISLCVYVCCMFPTQRYV